MTTLEDEEFGEMASNLSLSIIRIARQCGRPEVLPAVAVSILVVFFGILPKEQREGAIELAKEQLAEGLRRYDNGTFWDPE